ncbi:M57 family metalloprotease [Aquimarina aquimarini]|uniref:M57 family metalloprotease n=1 Tax=Aquimarina aquimarini TaxID=1191734 RepID=UPI000D559DD4|nr:M57 family metalloprotease [Aquimarina aquimarini]
MKKTFLKSLSKLLVLAVLGFATLFTSCEKEAPETFEQQETVHKQTRDTYLNISDENLSKGSSFAGRPNPELISNLTVFIDQGVPMEWVNPTVRAISEWNSVNTITMRRVFSRVQADIIVNAKAERPFLNNSPAGADFPDFANGPAGEFVTINLNYNNTNPVLTPNLRYYIMTHELGHTLGLHHADAVPRGANIDFMKNRVTEADENWGGISQQNVRSINRILFPNLGDPR